MSWRDGAALAASVLSAAAARGPPVAADCPCGAAWASVLSPALPSVLWDPSPGAAAACPPAAAPPCAAADAVTPVTAVGRSPAATDAKSVTPVAGPCGPAVAVCVAGMNWPATPTCWPATGGWDVAGLTAAAAGNGGSPACARLPAAPAAPLPLGATVSLPAIAATRRRGSANAPAFALAGSVIPPLPGCAPASTSLTPFAKFTGSRAPIAPSATALPTASAPGCAPPAALSALAFSDLGWFAAATATASPPTAGARPVVTAGAAGAARIAAAACSAATALPSQPPLFGPAAAAIACGGVPRCTTGTAAE